MMEKGLKFTAPQALTWTGSYTFEFAEPVEVKAGQEVSFLPIDDSSAELVIDGVSSVIRGRLKRP